MTTDHCTASEPHPGVVTGARSPLPGALALSAVALQIAYPLVHGPVRDVVTVLVVVVFAAACVAHAWTVHGVRVAGAVVILTAVPGFAVEVLGVHTGVPFGHYAYASSLGPRLLGVPPVVALAWTMLAWPAALVARRLVAGTAARILVGGWALASADLFLDPQMVAAGHWRWRDPSLHLPGVPGVPLSDFAGWLIVSIVLSGALQWLLRHAPVRGDLVAVALYLWLYVGWVVALGVFLALPAAAAWGALGMGVIAVPLALRLRLRR